MKRIICSKVVSLMGTVLLASCGYSSSSPAASSIDSSQGSLLVSSADSSEPFIDPAASIPVESSSISSSETVVSSSQESSQEVTSLDTSSAAFSKEEPIYDEQPDSMDCLDADDMSGLYGAFVHPITNYTSTSTTFFGEQALKDYYRRHKRNYVPEKTTLFTDKSMYTYPQDDRYLSVMNLGYVDLSNTISSFALKGETTEERLSYSLVASDLTLVKENDSYRNNLFTLEDLNKDYFTSYGFKRVSAFKYQYDRVFDTTKDNAVFANFLDICAPYFENEDKFMTFSKVTIETNPSKGVAFRIRIYAYSTDYGKLIQSHRKEDYQNWYLLFSETLITNVGATEFHPVSALLDEHSGHNPH